MQLEKESLVEGSMLASCLICHQQITANFFGKQTGVDAGCNPKCSHSTLRILPYNRVIHTNKGVIGGVIRDEPLLSVLYENNSFRNRGGWSLNCVQIDSEYIGTCIDF